MVTSDPKKSSEYINMGSSFEALVMTFFYLKIVFRSYQLFEVQNILKFRNIGKSRMTIATLSFSSFAHGEKVGGPFLCPGNIYINKMVT